MQCRFRVYGNGRLLADIRFRIELAPVLFGPDPAQLGRSPTA